MPLPSRRVLLVLFLIFAAAWFGTLEQRKLIRPDEGRYAEIAREMAVSGDYLTPRLNGLKYFEKPPLQYWASASAFRLLGESHWVARLWPALTGFLAILLVGYTAHRLWGKTSGVLALAIFGSMSWQVVNAHYLSLDAGLSAFLTLALCGFLLAQSASAHSATQKRWMLVTWAGMALAVLSKGLVGVVIPGASLVLYTLIKRDWALWKRLELLRGLALFLLIAAPWFVLCARANPEFAHFFFIHEHFERYLLPGHRREEAWYYFLPMLAAGALPWLPHLLAYGGRFWVSPTGPAKVFVPEHMLFLWAAFVLLFFSASNSKLPSYILPLFPALGLLLARHMACSAAPALGVLALPIAVIGLAGLVMAEEVTSQSRADAPLALYSDYVPWLEAAGLALALGGILAIVLAQNERRVHSVLALGFAGFLATSLASLGHDVLSPAKSSYHLVRTIRSQEGSLPADLPFYSVETYDQTLPYYLQRTVTLVNYRDEFSLGLDQEPQKGIAGFQEFARRWREHEQAYAVLQSDRYGILAAHQLPHRVLGRDPRFTIVARR